MPYKVLFVVFCGLFFATSKIFFTCNAHRWRTPFLPPSFLPSPLPPLRPPPRRPHSLAHDSNADKICVVEEGRVVETGRHDDLIKIEGGKYLQLVKLQLGGAVSGDG